MQMMMMMMMMMTMMKTLPLNMLLVSILIAREPFTG